MARSRFRAVLRAALGLHPTLDLHGYGVRDALRLTELFLREARGAGEDRVRIVYGVGRGSPGGRGVLRDVVPRWLSREGSDLVEDFERRPDASGADGYLIVRLRRLP